MEIKYQKFAFTSETDGLEIGGMTIAPADCDFDSYRGVKPKGIVQLVHGMCEHKERYFEFMEFLARRGYMCVIHDNRGHGESVKSKSDFGYLYEGGAKGLVEDVHQLTLLVQNKAYSADEKTRKIERQKMPYILLGHSMGSLIVRVYAKHYDKDIDRLIVVGCPGNSVGINLVGLTAGIEGLVRSDRKHSKLLDYMVFESVFQKKFRNEANPNAWHCSNQAVVEKYTNDPLCQFTFSIEGYRELIKLTKATYSQKEWEMKKPELPILFLSGKDDPCCFSPSNFGRAVHFMKMRGYFYVYARMYSGMRHEILNETRRKMVYRDIYTFIQSGKL